MEATLPPTSPSEPYPEVRPRLGTGDLLFLFGTSAEGVMVEQLENLAGLPPYSHVGMVIKDGDDLYLWDAPGGGNCFRDPYAADDPDNRAHATPVHPGCRVSKLDEVLAYYATLVHDPPGFWLRQLTPHACEQKFAALRTFINRVDGLPFTAHLGRLGMNFAVGKIGGTLFFGTYFCSQLVADSYMRMGLLKMESRPPNAYSPATFAMTDDTLPLVPQARLGEMLFVRWIGPTGGGTPCLQQAAPDDPF
jgi:hypothetical protein